MAVTWGSAQECPDIVYPANGASGIPLNATIDWESVEGVPSYNIVLGTSPGADDILTSQFASGSSYTPPKGLPASTTIYVTITLFFFDAPNIACPSFVFTTEPLPGIPACTQMTRPADMAIDVNPNTNIAWSYQYGATGYFVNLGTTPGSGDILNNYDAENSLSFNPLVDLPSETTIYVTIVPYNDLGTAVGCASQQFTTRTASAIPDCTDVIYPLDGDTNVPLNPVIEWNAIPDATGYIVKIGTTPSGSDILNSSTFYTNSTPIFNFEPNKTFFMTITPFNEAGQAEGCVQTSFTTLLGCGPYLDFETGEYVVINPETDLPDYFSTCSNDGPLVITATDIAEGYRWYRLNQFNTETLISETSEVSITENGLYRYEAYNTVDQFGNTIECPTSKTFEVVASETPTIEDLRVQSTGNTIQVTVMASGNGSYEYATGNIDGPYSENNVFSGLEPGPHTFYVRDINGCGVAERTFIQDLTVEGFPKFFTPNGDNVNDLWQFIQPKNSDPVELQQIRIFDRYGRFLKQISQNSLGWDGTFQGKLLPSGDYWFVATDDSNREIKGHFTLKR